MRLRLLLCCSALALALTARAGIISYSPSNPVNLTINDGDPIGHTLTATASGYLPTIIDIRVSLNIVGVDGGVCNGDLYCYLSYNNTLVPLLNRVGVQTGDAFGYGTAGMNVTLAGDPGGYADIHWTEFPTSGGTYAPDGRLISPAMPPSDPGDFDNNGTIGFSAYDGMNPNGTWTLFIADMSGGDQLQLVSWSLQITAVPEPVNVALGVFGSVVLVVAVARRGRVR